MHNTYSLALLAAILIGPLHAQTATDLNEGLRITYDGAQQEYTVNWWSRADHYYFLLETTDLVDDPWAYFPYAALGDDGVKGIVLSSSSDKMFFRVEWTNDTNSPMLQVDHDNDQVGTIDELQQGTDPFLSQSLDGDTIPDDWEVFHGLDTTVGVDSSGDDADGDGATDASEFTQGGDPAVRDHKSLSLELF